ncbi:stage II sporulation protein E [Oceanobacillus alkalisoli]|uniref:stage II sporulation protein E n=1 Tax=Oceanobacillus alkalisoli TaxID=2925113 RepID=UPI001EE47B86|nr:stage II sporulation protein E [Oceanobacillus alkalisoli]MCG5105128.1 stage II sporulation protein E [Oceanobacillus alkalisoli]
MMQSVESAGYVGWKENIQKKKQHPWKTKAKVLFIDRGLLLVMIGFLLGRAVILSAVSPFALAFLASVWLMQRKKTLHALLAVSLGAVTYTFEHTGFIMLSVLVFLILLAVFMQIKREKVILPFAVGFATMLPRIFFYSLNGPITSYEWLLIVVESVLGAVLVLIFMQSIPLLSPKRYKPTLRNEEIVCMIILIASILTGTIGWVIYGAAVEQIFARYFVLVFAFVGGAAIGSTVGVVVGLILSLANVANLFQMSLLAFSGLLGGLLKEGRKFGVAAGLLVGTLLIVIYGESFTLVNSLTESFIAIFLFFITPASWFSSISRYIPGTEEHAREQQQYSQKVRDVTANRVKQFSGVFDALARSFAVVESDSSSHAAKKRDTDQFLSQVTERTCQSCFMKERCWQKDFDKTYQLMEGMKEAYASNQEPSLKIRKEFENHCVKSKSTLEVMKEEMTYYMANHHLRRQVQESKRIVADQLFGVSEVMDDFANEILKEREHHEKQEMQIIEALKGLGIELEKLDIYQLNKGNVDIEMMVSFYDYHGEGEKLIAPVLTDILGEMIVVKEEEISPFPNGYSYLSFGSAKEYVVETGAANAAKGGGFISGDSFKTMELGEGKYAMAISDGMGNGRRAQEESEETLRLLQQILQIGIPEKVAIKSINSILALRTTDEMFATLDLAVIDLNHAMVKFLKVSAAPSFVKRGDEIVKIEAGNLPMGILHDVDIDIVSDQLISGDLLIMISDGVFDGPRHVENTDLWLKRTLKEMKTEDPQEIADLLLEEVIRTKSGEIDDDMTVLVAKINKNQPKWASVPIYPNKALG